MIRRFASVVSCTIALAAAPVLACPFCVAEMQTLSEELASADAAVLGRLLLPPALGLDPQGATSDNPFSAADPETGEATFRVEEVLKGEPTLGEASEVQAIYFGRADLEKRFLLRGIGAPLEWAVPIELSPLAVGYVKQLQGLPESGAERLAFFQPYLEHEDRQLAQDAYDEFARAPYDDLIRLKDEINHERVVELINRPRISPSRRRLFFVMLGVSGSDADLPMLDSLLESDAAVLGPATQAAGKVAMLAGGPLGATLAFEAVLAEERRKKLGLDAMIACYLTLRGDEGLDLIDRRFLANKDADQTHTYSTLMALRFLADEQQKSSQGTVERQPVVSWPRLLESARLLLDNAAFADQVVTDLARWEDWSVMPKLAEMYRAAGEKEDDEDRAAVSKYVREPIVTYLDVATEQGGEVAEQAEKYLAELEPIDPETFRRARSLHAFGFLGRARPPKPSGQDQTAADAGGTDAAPATEETADEMPPNPAEFETSFQPADEMPPDPWAADPAAFAAAEPGAEPKAEEQAEADDQSESKETATPLRTASIPAAAEPLTPPSRGILVLAPLAAAATCFALLWLILRGGV
ncbi:MAG: hypothetical protein AAGJ46_03975 [Planctomycetota bacterium]